MLQANVEERLPGVLKLEEESKQLRDWNVMDVEVPGQYFTDHVSTLTTAITTTTTKSLLILLLVLAAPFLLKHCHCCGLGWYARQQGEGRVLCLPGALTPGPDWFEGWLGTLAACWATDFLCAVYLSACWATDFLCAVYLSACWATDFLCAVYLSACWATDFLCAVYLSACWAIGISCVLCTLARVWATDFLCAVYLSACWATDFCVLCTLARVGRPISLV